MSDQQKLIRTLTEFGVVFEVLEGAEHFHVASEAWEAGARTIVRLSVGNAAVIGVPGYFTEYYFEHDGLFVATGVWKYA